MTEDDPTKDGDSYKSSLHAFVKIIFMIEDIKNSIKFLRYTMLFHAALITFLCACVCYKG
jgi:hypothetical protein